MSLTDYQKFAIGQIWFCFAVAILVATAYIILSPATQIASRIRLTVPSLLLVAAMVYIVLVSRWNHVARVEVLALPFWFLLACFLGDTVRAVYSARGDRSIHFLHVIQVPAAMYLLFVGNLIIAGDGP